jgi:NADPH:quinone reductase
MPNNRQIILVQYADGVPGAEHFALREAELPDLAPGQLRARVIWLSMDPFPRLRMGGDARVAPQLPLGSVMIGRGVARVTESRHESFAAGDYLAGELGWQEQYQGDGAGLRPVDPTLAPVQTSLGILGPSGLAAYFATLREGRPRAGETVVVSAAAGSVGLVACQLALMQGANVVGVVGGAPQEALLRELGVTPVNYRVADLGAAIGAACPAGVDLFIDNVGGTVHDAVMERLNVHARAVLVGTIADYTRPPGEQEQARHDLLRLILRRVRISGFMVGDYAAEWPAALGELAGWLQAGRLRNVETVFAGLEQAPEAFAALFGGASVGKRLVRVDDEGATA